MEDVMGYAMRVDTYRFVEWYGFDRSYICQAQLDEIWGTELYDHTNSTVFFNDDNVNHNPNMTEKV